MYLSSTKAVTQAPPNINLLAGTLLIINLLSNYVTQRTMSCSNADTYSHFLARQLFRELLLNMAMQSFWPFFKELFLTLPVFLSRIKIRYFQCRSVSFVTRYFFELDIIAARIAL